MKRRIQTAALAVFLALTLGACQAGRTQNTPPQMRSEGGYIQYYDGTDWVDLVSLNELRGEQGPAGQNGNAGQDGTDGQDGIDGKNGATGPAGQPGMNGQDGQDGKDGAVFYPCADGSTHSRTDTCSHAPPPQNRRQFFPQSQLPPLSRLQSQL